ncbi:hypothetical protein ACWD25_36385, partial [Streptomyces sp. NPDC002920]
MDDEVRAMTGGTDSAGGWSRRRFVGVLGGAAAASALAGCGSGSPDAREDVQEAAPPPQASPSASGRGTDHADHAHPESHPRA